MILANNWCIGGFFLDETWPHGGSKEGDKEIIFKRKPSKLVFSFVFSIYGCICRIF